MSKPPVRPETFIDKLVKKNELGQPFRLMNHQREVLRLAFDFDQDGHLPWDTILYSCIKKSGKTTLNGAFIQHNPELQREAEVQTKTIYLANGTTLTAISGDYQGAAGSNHGFVSYDELWGYTSEASIRLWEELTPVPTRKNSAYTPTCRSSVTVKREYSPIGTMNPVCHGRRLHTTRARKKRFARAPT
jgi:hypothetical protein